MKRTLPFPFCILIVMGLALMFVEPVKATDQETDLENAATFLQNQFNSTLQLCAEAPWVRPNYYWLVEDNLLAYHAIKYYNETMATEIYSKLQEYSYMKNFACEALFKQTLELPFRHCNIYTVEEGAGYIIKINMYNGSTKEDWKSYGNLLIFAALSEYWKCWYDQTALGYFNQAAAMWDGKGIVDKAFQEGEAAGIYQTYKLAMLLYAERILGQSLSFHDTAENIIWQMQNSTNYGIHTGYDETFDPLNTDVNVETTSLVIGSYKWEYEPLCPTVSLLPKVYNNSVIVIVVVALTMYVVSYLERNRWRR